MTRATSQSAEEVSANDMVANRTLAPGRLGAGAVAAAVDGVISMLVAEITGLTK